MSQRTMSLKKARAYRLSSVLHLEGQKLWKILRIKIELCSTLSSDNVDELPDSFFSTDK